MADDKLLNVAVVSAERAVWEGEASVIKQGQRSSVGF